MLPEASMASITVSTREGSITTALGRVMANSNEASASSSSTGGVWRRHRDAVSIAGTRLA